MELREDSFNFPPFKGSGPRQAVTAPMHRFPRRVLSAVAGITGYSVSFRSRGRRPRMGPPADRALDRHQPRRSARRRSRRDLRIARLPLARLAPHPGQLARAARHAAICTSGVGRLGERGDGAALRASGRGSLGTLCGTSVCFAGRGFENSGHNLGTGPKNEGLASLQALDCLVAGEGFEPSTFGL